MLIAWLDRRKRGPSMAKWRHIPGWSFSQVLAIMTCLDPRPTFLSNRSWNFAVRLRARVSPFTPTLKRSEN